MRLQTDRSMEGRKNGKVKNGRMEVRMKWKYGMAFLGFRTYGMLFVM